MHKTVAYNEVIEFSGVTLTFVGSYQENLSEGYPEGTTEESLDLQITVDGKDTTVLVSLDTTDIYRLHEAIINLKSQPLPTPKIPAF